MVPKSILDQFAAQFEINQPIGFRDCPNAYEAMIGVRIFHPSKTYPFPTPKYKDYDLMLPAYLEFGKIHNLVINDVLQHRQYITLPSHLFKLPCSETHSIKLLTVLTPRSPLLPNKQSKHSHCNNLLLPSRHMAPKLIHSLQMPLF